MKKFLRTGVLLAACLVLLGTMTGCDKARQTLEKTDLGATSDLTRLVTKALPQLESAITKVTSVSGVSEVVGPTLASLQEKFKSMM